MHVARLAAVTLVASLLSTGTARAQEVREFAVLAINDVYRIEGLAGGREGGLARVATLRRDIEAEFPDLITLHAGDLLYPSLMSRMYAGRQMISTLNVLDGDPVRFDDRMFVAFGNHEFDANDAEDVGSLSGALQRSQFTWLGSGVTFRERVTYPVGSGRDERTITEDGIDAARMPNLREQALVSVGGVWVGIFGLTLPVEGVEYVESFLDTPSQRLAYARSRTAALREAGAEFVIGLTHLSLDADLELLSRLGPAGPDLVVGGHDHDRVHELVAGRHIIKADAEARSANLIRVTLSDSDFPQVTVTPMPLDARVAPEPQVADTVQGWVDRHNREFCGAQSPSLPGDCLDDSLAELGKPVVAEELQIRTGESAFGKWVADEMLEAVNAAGGSSSIAVINSGAFRLNQNLPAGVDFTRRHLEELVQFDGALHEITLTGEDIEDMLELSARCFGSGPWLQFVGLSAEFDPVDRLVSGIRVGGQALQESATYSVVVPAYLASGGDGYGLFADKPRTRTLPSVRDVLSSALQGLNGAPLPLAYPPTLSSTDLPFRAVDPCPYP